MVVEKEGLCTPFPLIIARAKANGIDVAPIFFCLGVDVGIAVDFRGRGLENFTFQSLGKAEEVHRAENAGFEGLNRICLVMRRRGGAGEVVDFVDFYMEGETDIVANQLKAACVEKMEHIFPRACKKIVHTENFMPLIEEPFTKMGAEKSGAACNQNFFHKRIS
jgi:hypothetical protein